jgi:putative tricarboxylic transport membrane protein
MDPAAQTDLIDLVTQAHDTADWKDILTKNGFDDEFLPGEEYGRFLAEEQQRVTAILDRIGLT